MSDAAMMWAPWFADVDRGLLNEPVVMFSSQFTHALARWESEHGATHLGATWRFSIEHADPDIAMKGTLITYRGGGVHRIWRLTGELDERGGYIGVWPD